MMKRDISAEYNRLPIEVRELAGLIGLERQIRDLKREKTRLKNRYQRSLSEINEMLKDCEKDLAEGLSASISEQPN